MLKIGALIVSYHSTKYLPIVLKMYEWVDRKVVMNYRYKTVAPTTDNTKEICAQFGRGDLIVESGDGIEQHEIRNRGLDILSDCDLVWVSDADEIILPDDQSIIMNRMADRRPLCGLASHATCNVVDYNGDMYHASPQRGGLTMVIAEPKKIRFSHIRSIEKNNAEARMPHATMHHLGLVFDDQTLDWKAEWEHKEERQTKESILRDWGVRRNVTPPVELLELINANEKKSTWGFRIEKVPAKGF